MRMQLSLHRHVRPLFRRALRGERAFERADLTVFQSDIRGEAVAPGVDVDEAGSQRRVLLLTAGELVRQMGVHEVEPRGALQRLRLTPEHPDQSADLPGIL